MIINLLLDDLPLIQVKLFQPDSLILVRLIAQLFIVWVVTSSALVLQWVGLVAATYLPRHVKIHDVACSSQISPLCHGVAYQFQPI